MVTRWNSQLAMVDRLLVLRKDLTSVCGGMYKGKEVMSDSERKACWPADTTWQVS